MCAGGEISQARCAAGREIEEIGESALYHSIRKRLWREKAWRGEGGRGVVRVVIFLVGTLRYFPGRGGCRSWYCMTSCYSGIPSGNHPPCHGGKTSMSSINDGGGEWRAWLSSARSGSIAMMVRTLVSSNIREACFTLEAAVIKCRRIDERGDTPLPS